MPFRVGQKVVCISDDRNPMAAPGVKEAIKGNVYTVRWIGFGSFMMEIQPAIRVQEIVNAQHATHFGVREPCFQMCAFRPVQTTDISIFTAMLAPTPKQRVRIEG